MTGAEIMVLCLLTLAGCAFSGGYILGKRQGWEERDRIERIPREL